ncbi:hypothetical protein F0U61_34875 [Archangium violaceum]|uniref:hypothetical protein n=1 Tax=Archangium violaceum TaxID=83451 RepID=UPI002B302683|nr:hypothetical protein F0U61_34875 [Archangium violaceum]
MPARRILHTAAVMAGLVPSALVALPGQASAQTSSTPSITWNTYLGGTAADGGFSDDRPQGIITNRLGDTFVVGNTNAASFPKGLPSPLATGGDDAFVTKYDADGRVVWTRVFGGPKNDVGLRLAFVPYSESHLYIVGTTASSSIGNVSRTVGALKGDSDAFLARLDLDGTVRWFMYLDGPGLDEGRDVNVYEKDGNRVVYVVGKRDDDVFVTQVDDTSASDPAIAWSTTFGSPGVDVAYAVATNEFHRVFVGGSVSQSVSSGLPTPLNTFGGGTSDGFIAQLNPKGGTVNWFQYLGGNGPDDVRDLLNQPESGGVTAVGNSLSTNFPPEFTRRGQEIFLVRVVTDNGGLQEKKLLVGEGGEYMEGHASADVVGNIYFGGSTTSPNLALNAFDPHLDPGTFQNDGFVAMVDPDLTGFVWASYVGGPASLSEAVMGVSAVPRGQLTFMGHSNASEAGVLVVDAGDDLQPNGGMEGFVFRLPVDPNAKPPDGGTTPGQDGGTTPGQDGGTTPGQDGGLPGPNDAGVDPGQPDDEQRSPLGWGCGSAGGGASVGAVALMALALLLRRARS